MWEKYIDWFPPACTQTRAPCRGGACNLGTCPWLESILGSFGPRANALFTELSQPGLKRTFNQEFRLKEWGLLKKPREEVLGPPISSLISSSDWGRDSPSFLKGGLVLFLHSYNLTLWEGRKVSFHATNQISWHQIWSSVLWKPKLHLGSVINTMGMGVGVAATCHTPVIPAL